MKRSVLSVIAVLAILVLATLAPAPPSLAAGEPERVLVEFAPGRAAAARNALEGAGGQIHYQFDSLNTFAVTLPAAALDGISRNPNVVSVEPDAPRYPMAQEIPWGITDVQAPQVQTAGVTGAGTKVCIIDSGLYTAHEDLLGVPATGYGTDWNRDFCGHGTHVAGTIAAANNGVGVVGVAPAVSLFSVKVFGDDCSWTYTSTLVDATNRCVAGGAKIISMSLGGAKSSRTERTQFANLYSAGILSIAAAGNEGTTAYSYPASYDTVVSVAAIDSSKTVADFSQQNDQVELAAPGVSVLSTVPWLATVNLTVGGATYPGQHIENAAYGTATGALANGGLCDSTGSWSGKVVLCERGVISFYDKVMNVQNSGGAAAVIYNNEPGNFLGTLGDGYSSTILASSTRAARSPARSSSHTAATRPGTAPRWPRPTSRAWRRCCGARTPRSPTSRFVTPWLRRRWIWARMAAITPTATAWCRRRLRWIPSEARPLTSRLPPTSPSPRRTSRRPSPMRAATPTARSSPGAGASVMGALRRPRIRRTLMRPPAPTRSP